MAEENWSHPEKGDEWKDQKQCTFAFVVKGPVSDYEKVAGYIYSLPTSFLVYQTRVSPHVSLWVEKTGPEVRDRYE